MDTYAEQLVIKQTNSSDQMKKFGIAAGGILLITVLLYITIFIMPIAILAVIGVAYGAFRLLRGMNIEYEYTVTNGSLDIDKIIAKRKRVTLLSVDVKEFTDFGNYFSHNDNFEGITVLAVGGEEEPLFADFKNEQYGTARLIFSPNEKILQCIKPYLPRTIKYR